MKRIDVSAFIDWQSQLINSGAVSLTIPRRAAEKSLAFVTSRISALLEEIDAEATFFVVPKIYHGWHRGLTPTRNLIALREAIEDRVAPFRVGRASFDWQQPFGSILSDCLPHRLHPVLRIHLPNTLRADIKDPSKIREKMVDAALSCDVLSSAKSSPAEIRLILAEDDDLIPAAFTAESWSKERGGRTFIVRKRDQAEFVNMTGIYKRLEVEDAA